MESFLAAIDVLISWFPGNKALVLNVAILIAVANLLYRHKWLRHPRFKLRFILLIVMILATLNLLVAELPPPLITGLLICLLALYGWISYRSVRRVPGFSMRAILRLQALPKIGNSGSLHFPVKPWFLIDFLEWYFYCEAKVDYHCQNGNFKEAYDILTLVGEEKLLEDEKERIISKKAFILCHLGNMTKAQLLLDSLGDQTGLQALRTRALILENMGDIDRATEVLQRALDNLSGQEKDWIKVAVFSDYGRIREIAGNALDAARHYGIALEHARSSGDTHLLHVAFQNYIAIQNEESRRQQSLVEYTSMMDSSVVQDLLELHNFKLALVRQARDRESEIRLITVGYGMFSAYVADKERLLLDIATMRMAHNAGFFWPELLEIVFGNVEKYKRLPMPDRFHCLWEMGIIVSCGVVTGSAAVSVRHYLCKAALLDIERYIDDLPHYNILERCHYEKAKAGLLAEFASPYGFAEVYEVMKNVRDIYQQNGRLIEALEMDLNIADECCRDTNLSGGEIKHESKEKMRQHVDMAKMTIGLIKKHPATYPALLRIAAYSDKLGDSAEAIKYLGLYEASSHSPHHLADWLQGYYRYLASKY